MASQKEIINVRLENHPPMLYQGGYTSWSSRMLSYIEDKENGHLIQESIEN